MRFPWTIWRFTLVEVWRLLLMTSLVLVVVVSFAVMVKFLAAGRLAPVDILSFMALACVPMMQYTLPFAAGFAATIAFHRMAQDNELTGVMAAGISRRRLLFPAAATGAAVLVLLGLLTNLWIPRLLRSMEGLVGDHVTKAVVRAVERHEPVVFGNRMLWADEVRRREAAPGDEQGVERLLLLGVIAVELDERGEVAKESSARMAWLTLRPWSGDGGEDGSSATLIAARLFDAEHRERGDAFTMEQWDAPAQVVPGAFDDDPKYLTYAELRGAYAAPDCFNFITSRRRRLAIQAAEGDAAAVLSRDLRAQGLATLVAGEADRYHVRASGLKWQGQRWDLQPLEDGGVVVELVRRAAPAYRLVAASGGIMGDREADPESSEPRLRLVLEDVRGFEGDSEAGRLTSIEFKGLRLADEEVRAMASMPSETLLAELRPRVEGQRADGSLVRPWRELRDRVDRVRREITSKEHERAAVAVSGLIMVLTGALTGMRLAGSLPLVVYLWSFFPALAALLTISAGQQMTHQMGAPGLLVLWGGVAGLALYAAAAWRVAAAR